MSVLILKIIPFICFFLAMLDLHPLHGPCLVSESGSHYPVAVHGPLTVVARARLWVHRLPAVATCGLSICSSRALKNRLYSCDALLRELCSMLDSHRPGTEPMYPTLTGLLLLTTEPQGSLCAG